MSETETKNESSRLFALNRLCPECAKIIAWREAHPELEIAHPGSVLIDTRTLTALLKHHSHIDINWRNAKDKVIR